MEQAHEAVDTAEKALRKTTDKVARAAHEAVETLRDYGDRAEEQFRGVTENSREIMDRVSGYIEARPWAALGIAAAVGFTLGALAGRRSPHEEDNA